MGWIFRILIIHTENLFFQLSVGIEFANGLEFGCIGFRILKKILHVAAAVSGWGHIRDKADTFKRNVGDDVLHLSVRRNAGDASAFVVRHKEIAVCVRTGINHIPKGQLRGR